MNDTKIEKIRSVLQTIDNMVEVEGRRGDLDSSQDTLSDQVERESEREREQERNRERISPLEEWNTLHRSVREHQARASIKLKESSIV